MPKLLFARPAQDTTEERQVCKLANSRHAPGDWIRRARMIVLSWQGLHTTAIASELHCHPQTVRERLTAFNTRGLDGLGDRPGAGRKRRITEAQRSILVSLVARIPPGRLVRQSDGSLGPQDEAREEEPAHWTLNALTAAARARGLKIARSQVRRILLAEGVPWRGTHSWAKSTDPNFRAKERRLSRATPAHRRTGRPSASMSLDQ
jgi:transposase